nr:tRNA lysidine(34) synthetase TilS [Ruegeria sp. HKCCD7255]
MSVEHVTLQSILRAHLPDPLPRRLGVAASGGSDSTALMHLLADITQQEGIALYAATVDHGLRSESAAEASSVAAQASALGIPHHILKWEGWDGTGNLQDQARRARYQLLTRWARDHDLPAIALGHTADDQAETVLMRLGRAAGVSGLSAMAAIRREDCIDLLRPLLSVTRSELRAYLAEAGVAWIDDPSNQDDRFDRIKTRNAMAQLEQIGLTAQALSRVADNMAQAREALALYAQEAARRVTKVSDGDICIDVAGFVLLPIEIRRRILTAAILWIAGGAYAPRHSAVDQAMRAVVERQNMTIGGCMLVPAKEKLWICRELNAVSHEVCDPLDLWDQRWVLSGPSAKTAEIRVLGEDGISQVKDWRAMGKPRAAILASPALWQGDTVLSAPMAGFGNGWRADLTPEQSKFYCSILSH